MSQTILRLEREDDAAGFWRLACSAVVLGETPADVRFVVGEAADLFGAVSAADADRATGAAPSFDQRLVSLIDHVVLHSDPERFALAYRLLWRSLDEPALASVASDPDIARAHVLSKSVARDKHKMTAFVRFRERAASDGQAEFVAWFEPQHYIVRAIAPFFVGRFTGMRWSILTPYASAHWDGTHLMFGAGGRKTDAPEGDPLEDVWKIYYGSIFNPARVKVKAMTAQMPKKYWRNLPEADLIVPLIRSAPARAQAMIEAAPTLPRRRHAEGSHSCGGATSITGDTPETCQRCPLHASATQAVLGEGPQTAALMIVGEQPGDTEDLVGRPFVGPAGKLLDIALQRSDIELSAAYLTNAVKHFKFEPRGKRRLHKSPSRDEIDHCRWWLDLERATVKPRVVLALGVSAVRGLTGRTVPLASVRSTPQPLADGPTMIATVHPAYMLRLTDEAQKRAAWRAFLADLAQAQALVEETAADWRARQDSNLRPLA